MTSVFCTLPNRNGWIHKLVRRATDRIRSDSRYQVRYDEPTHSPYVNNLHRCLRDFLSSTDEWWLTIDDDNPPTRNPLDLIELDLDVVACPTPVWANMKSGDRPWYFNALDKVPGGYQPHQPCVGLQEVDAVGSGCLLISRRVAERLRWQQPFLRQWTEDGTVGYGGDYSFSQKAKAAGFRVWAHFDYVCDHINELPLLEVIQAFDAAYRRGVA